MQMPRNFGWFLFPSIIFVCGFVTPAQANLLPYLSSTAPATVDPGDTIFNYSASLSNDERMDAFGTGNTAFFTIYDFPGYIATSIVAPTDWVASVQDVGITPVGVSVTDDPTVLNLTFTYEGTATIIGVGQTFTGFSAVSSDSYINSNGAFTQQSTKNAGPAAGGRDAGLGPESVPTAIPEPSTLVLLGAALALLSARPIMHKRLSRPTGSGASASPLLNDNTVHIGLSPERRLYCRRRTSSRTGGSW